MSTHGFYLAASYAAFVLAIAIELLWLRRSRQQALRDATHSQEDV
jgi:heme exporter protein CcmD